MISHRDCQIRGCQSPRFKRGFCKMHYEMESSRYNCRWPGCNAKRCAPVTDGLCENHHPSYRRLTTLEATAVAAAAEGRDPAAALVETGLTKRQAKAELTQERKRPSYQKAMARLARKAGIRPADHLRAIGRALKAQRLAKVIPAVVYGDDDGAPREPTFQMVDDHKTQLHAAELYHNAVHGKLTLKIDGSEKDEAPRRGIVFITDKVALPPEIRAVVVDDSKDDE